MTRMSKIGADYVSCWNHERHEKHEQLAVPSFVYFVVPSASIHQIRVLFLRVMAKYPDFSDEKLSCSNH